ncbi:unnamed protein product [Mycena citricolor]|uniref:DDE-1 domain-containing protein n=1 Tax=Mycena citricolor TaxID=2018698 RepID=A0AAD2K8M2_9AGAR|nr:unnamed protein product [Mycena citricolor]
MSTMNNDANGSTLDDELELNDADLKSLLLYDRQQLAIAAIKRGTSQREACALYRVNRATVANRIKGMPTREQAHVKERAVSPAQEEIFVEFIKVCDCCFYSECELKSSKVLGHRGIPLTVEMINAYAGQIAGKELGKTWGRRFLVRHKDALKVKNAASLEECRAKSLTRPVVHKYFEMLSRVIQEFNIKPKHIYNMDEKGIQLGMAGRLQVVVDRDQRNVQAIANGNRELVTIIECVSADGEVLCPSVVFQGLRRDNRWGANNPCNASISLSPNGWTDQELGTLWLKKDFDPQSAARLDNPNDYRLLILDGHNSHCTYTFVSYAKDHKIIIICLPAHTTHALQPCDVGIFGPLATYWKKQVIEQTATGVVIDKCNLLYNYHQARTRAFKKATILNAFRKCGIHPLDENAIPGILFAPSKNYTTQDASIFELRVPALLVPVEAPAATPVVESTVESGVDADRTTVSADGVPMEEAFNNAHLMNSETEDIRDAAPSGASTSGASTPPTALETSSSSSTVTVGATAQSALSDALELSPIVFGRADNSGSATVTCSQTRLIPSSATREPSTATSIGDPDRPHSLYKIELPPRLPSNASRARVEVQNEQLRGMLEEAAIELEKNHAQIVLMAREHQRVRQQLLSKKKKDRRAYNTGAPRLMTGNEMLEALLHDDHKKAMSELHQGMKKKLAEVRKALTAYENEAQAAAKATEKELEKTRKAAEKAAKVAKKAAEKAAKAAERSAKKAEKAAERGAKKAEKAAERAASQGRGRGRGRGSRGRGRGGRGRGNRGRGGHVALETEAAEEEMESSGEESDDIDVESEDVIEDKSEDEKSEDQESEDEGEEFEDEESEGESDAEERGKEGKGGSNVENSTTLGSVDATTAAASPEDVFVGIPTGNDSDTDNSTHWHAEDTKEDEVQDEEETGIVAVNGHRWFKRKHLQLLILWNDDDATWEPLSNVDDCTAMDEYLQRHSLEDPLLLPRRKFLIDATVKASNE